MGYRDRTKPRPSHCTRCGEHPPMLRKTICVRCNHVAIKAGMDRVAEGQAPKRRLSAEDYAASNRQIAQQIEWMERGGLLPDSRRRDGNEKRYPTSRVSALAHLRGNGAHGFYSGGQRVAPKAGAV